MTDYNDGKWHGWNGGECPVHPESVVELVTERGSVFTNRKAGITAWDMPPFLFRVTKQHKEPCEFWIDPDRGQIVTKYREGFIHVREVTE